VRRWLAPPSDGGLSWTIQRAITQVTLSGPPFSLAASIKRWVALGISGARDDVEDALIVDRAGETVAAKHDGVSGPRRFEARVAASHSAE
jgi:hypothetical protein